jgi:hypothetical protein
MDYRFLKTEKDPILSLIEGECQLQYGQELNHTVLAKIAYDSGISESTLRAWFFGDTHRPQNITVRMVLQALNCKVKIYRQDGTEVRGPRRHETNSGRKSAKVSAQSQAAVGAA